MRPLVPLRRRGERGAESLELVAVLPLVALVLLLAWQGILLVRQQVEAEADARALVRQAALCGTPGALPPLASVDPGAAGEAVLTAAEGPYVAVSVRLVPRSVIPGLTIPAASGVAPHAVASMRREPC